MRGILKGCMLAGAGFVLGRACAIYQAEQALKNAPLNRKKSDESVIFGTEKDARQVLSELKGVIERYGWTSLSSAEIVPVTGGFEIRFPSVQPIN